MRRILFFLLAAGLLLADEGPLIGVIDFYGVRKASKEDLRKALGAKEGDPLPASKGNTEEALEGVNPVVRAQLEAVCCEDAKAILYVGIEEKGAPHFDYLVPPDGEVALPPEIHDEYVHFLGAVNEAVRTGNTSEDLSQGHSLMSHPDVRRHQEEFLKLASANLDILRKVLRESADEEQRAIAAYVLGYAPKGDVAVLQQVIDDLQHALHDPNDTVRNNAIRSLGGIAVLSQRKPDLKIQVQPTWFIEMLGSIIWQDRMAATNILVTMTENRDPEVLERIKARKDELVEMADWRHLPHALPAFILLGRVSGIAEPEIERAWNEGDHAQVIRRWAAK